MKMDNETVDVTQVGPGTVGGNFLRQYWVPCMLSKELVADGTPIRLPLLGEKLIAFRDSAGRVGIMDQRCPHRCASLFLGRNEEDGLRCVYHGWKFDVEGNCVDSPSVPEPEGSTIRAKIKAKAYKVVERNGLVWVYMGLNQESPPPLPAIEVNMLPESEVRFSFVARDCNWLQSLEGDIDTAHFGFLHTGALDISNLDPSHALYPQTLNRSPKYEVAETPWGTSYGAYRPAGDGLTYWRVSNFMFPFFTHTPQGDFSKYVHTRAWVPIDDHRTMLISMGWVGALESALNPFSMDGYWARDNLLPNTSDWYGFRFKLRENEANDWMIDREAQRSGVNFTGLDNIHLQDQAVTESMAGNWSRTIAGNI